MTIHMKRGAGGYRPGGGRKKGSKDKKPRKRIAGTKVRAAQLAAAKIIDEIKDQDAKRKPEMPLERLMRRMNDPNVPNDVRDQLATWAAPYTHAKLSSVALRPGVAPVDEKGKPIEGAGGTGKGKVTVTMAFDNTGDIKEGEEKEDEE